MTVNVMSGNLGDIFWDLPNWLTYSPGYDLGCNIYVANQTAAQKEYALMAKMVRNGTALTEEALPVFGYTWFKVDPNDFITLKGAMRFSETDADLTVQLIEKESGEVTDSVTTRLVSTTNTSALPPAWPGSNGSSGGNWSSLLNTLLPFLMIGIIAMVMLKPQKEKVSVVAPAGQKDRFAQGGKA
jgi:hypothetical protein